MMVRRILGVVSPLLLLASGPAQARDTVRLHDGTTETGTVKSEEFTGLTLTGAKTTTWTWDKIAAVTYGGSPEFTKAMTAVTQGIVADTIPQLEALMANQKLRPVLRQQALFHLGAAQQRTGKLDEAIASFQTVVSEFPKTRYLAPIADGLYACHVAKQDLAGAGSALDKLAASARAAGADKGLLASIDVRKARLLEEQKKHPEAKAAYEAAMGAGVPPEIVAEAKLGVGRCLQAQGQPAEAERLYRELILTKTSPRHALAGAWNGIGDGMQEEGRKSRSADRLLEALYAYLRGVVQYAPLPGEATDEHERALAGSARCFKSLSELEQDPERRKLLADRAQERKAQLEREFPQSIYRQGL